MQRRARRIDPAALVRANHRKREAGQVGAQGERARHVQAAAHSAGRDHAHPRSLLRSQDAHRRSDAGRGRESPVAEQLAEGGRLCRLRAQLLHPRPARAAGAAHVDDAHLPRDQLAHDVGADPASGLLDDEPLPQLLGKPGDRVEAAGEVAVAAVLHQLLCGIQVDGDTIRADQLDEPQRRVAAALHELLRAQVGEQPRRPGGPHVERREQLGLVEQHAHGAHPERDALLLGDARQVPVDLPGPVGPSGHPHHHEGRPQARAGHLRGEVDVGEAQFGERAVHQPDAAEEGVRPGGFHLLALHQVEVLRLAPAHVVVHDRGSNTPPSPAWHAPCTASLARVQRGQRRNRGSEKHREERQGSHPTRFLIFAQLAAIP